MLTNRKVFYVVLIIALAAIFYYEHRKLDSNLSNIESDFVSEKNKNLSTAPQMGIKKIENESSTTSMAVAGTTGASPTPQNFQAWFTQEAQNLEASTKDPAEKEALLKAQAQQLTALEINFLRKKAVDTKATANERIAAAYLLTLSTSVQSLAEVSQSPLSLPSPQAVHSIGEAQLMQEKAIRVMAIDELFNRASSDAAVRNQLLSIINRMSDEGLKQYALKRYREMK